MCPGVIWSLPNALTPPTGVSVVVPARDTPDLLASSLPAAQAAIERVNEPSEIIVVVSGAGIAGYAELRRSFPRVKWIFRTEPLGYGAAVELGLANSTNPWVYLLNSDMMVHPHALMEVLKLRRDDTFAIGSRIRMYDGATIETNWTDLRFLEHDAVELIERDPETVRDPRGCLYAGGGSSLFRASLLRKFLPRTRAYSPFYWEDVEWGSLAWRYGYRSTFCPASEAIHRHRQTIRRYYSSAEVSRVFERNRTMFHLRNLSRLQCLEERLLSLDPDTWADIFHPRALLETVWARARCFMAPHTEEVLRDRWKISH